MMRMAKNIKNLEGAKEVFLKQSEEIRERHIRSWGAAHRNC